MKAPQIVLFALLCFFQKINAQIDTVPPTIVCNNQLSVYIGPTCLETIFANDLIDTAYDNTSQVKLGVRRRCVGSGFPSKDYVRFTSENQGTQTVEVWAKDFSGNTSSCLANLFIGDNIGVCGAGTINMRFETALEEGIDSVYVDISGENCLLDTFNYSLFEFHPDTFPSFLQGSYQDSNVVPTSTGYDFEVVPYKNDSPLNGVTTYDLSLISIHILGLEPFDSPYKIIAADANQDGKVTTYDIIILRKLILGILDELPNGKSWRFLPFGYNFLNPQDPFTPPFPEKFVASSEEEFSPREFNFKGVKIGDVNFSADPN